MEDAEGDTCLRLNASWRRLSCGRRSLPLLLSWEPAGGCGRAPASMGQKRFEQKNLKLQPRCNYQVLCCPLPPVLGTHARKRSTREIAPICPWVKIWGTRAERARCCLRHRAREAFSSARSLTTRRVRKRSACARGPGGVHTLFIEQSDGMV